MLKVLVLILFISTSAIADNQKAIFAIQGKYSSLSWDFGVLKAGLRYMKAVRDNDIILTANSSGSIVASFLSCRGISIQSIDEGRKLLEHFDRKSIDETTSIRKIIRILMGKPTEYPISKLEPMIDMILQYGECTPKLPLLIVASNADILNNRSRNPLQGLNQKKFDEKNYNVYLKDKFLGKACTYFADPVVYDIIKRIPYQERLCDIRLIRTSEDMKMAIIASVSEPTYFKWAKEVDINKIIREDGQPDITERYYNGGYTMPGPVQDIKRVYPKLYAIGTGRPPHKDMEQKLVQSWSLVRIGRLMSLTEWWLDAETSPTSAEWESMKKLENTYEEEYFMGYEAGTRCFTNDNCISSNTVKPHYGYALTGETDTQLTQRSLKPLLNK